MGQRFLRMTPQVLVEFYKEHDPSTRTYNVERPLPADTRFVDFQLRHGGFVDLLLESEEWIGRSDVLLEPPIGIVTFLDAEEVQKP
jgi:hypothetical protein